MGAGFELSGNSGDVFGYVDENNNIVLNGNLSDGSYSIKYEMEDDAGNVKTIDIGNLVLDSNVYYSVTNNLTNCTNSNSATQAVGGQAYNATITADSGYELSSVTVTMGGNPVTVSGGSISIAEVTGNIVITAVAEEATVTPSYTNRADPTSSDWVGDSRLGSGGSIREQAGCIITNYIGPLSSGDAVEVKGIDLTGHNCTIYSGDKAAQSTAKLSAQTFYTDIVATATGGSFIVGSNAGIQGGYVRFSGVPNGSVNDIIITINESIA